MSRVYFKFRSAKGFDYITFDGNDISIFDLKIEILKKKGLQKATDFDLNLYNTQTLEEYTNDLTPIPKNSSVFVMRLPAAKPGFGNIRRYMGPNGMPAAGGLMGALSRIKLPGAKPDAFTPGLSGFDGAGGAGGEGDGQLTEADLENMTDEERLAAFQKQNESQWAFQKQQMANAKHIPMRYRPPAPSANAAAAATAGAGGAGGAGASAASGGAATHVPPYGEQVRPPPDSYLCFRCGHKGHWIQMCPTMGNEQFDRPRLKRTTGIPKIFLQTVAREEAEASGGGVMVTADGSFVVARPNEAAFEKATAAQTKSQSTSVGDLYRQLPPRPGMACPICKYVIRDAVQLPCCKSNFCDDCIRSSLLDNDDEDLRFKCRVCLKFQLPDNLVVNTELRRKIEAYAKEWTRKQREDAAAATDGDGAAATTKRDHEHPQDGPEAKRQKTDAAGAATAPATTATPASATSAEIQSQLGDMQGMSYHQRYQHQQRLLALQQQEQNNQQFLLRQQQQQQQQLQQQQQQQPSTQTLQPLQAAPAYGAYLTPMQHHLPARPQ